MTFWKKALTPFVLSLAITLTACGGSEEVAPTTTPPPPVELNVVVTSPILADFVSTLGSDNVEVYNMVKTNVDPHDYEPTPADIQALSKAKVIVRNGVGLDTWLNAVIKSSGTQATVVDASAGVTLRKEGGEDDPHIWHSPLNAKIMVSNIRQAMAAADAPNAAGYSASERAYDAQIDALDADIRRSLGTLTNKKLVTNHDSLGYYVDEFKLDYVGAIIPSFSTQAELAPEQITDIVNKIKAQQVKAVFSESSIPSRTAETIATEAGVKIVQGDDALYGDTLGDAQSGADTYLNMERHNTRVIVSNLA